MCWNPSFTVYWISCVNKLIWVTVLLSIDKTTSTILVHVQKSDPMFSCPVLSWNVLPIELESLSRSSVQHSSPPNRQLWCTHGFSCMLVSPASSNYCHQIWKPLFLWCLMGPGASWSPWRRRLEYRRHCYFTSCCCWESWGRLENRWWHRKLHR